jgi:hypothetical protein
MATTYRYRLVQAPEARTDGTGYIQHDIQGIRDIDGDDEVIPGYHSSVNIHSDDVSTVMDMPDSTGPERALKNAAYKALIGPAIGFTPSPGTRDWSKSGMKAYSDTNDAAGVEADRIDTYITVTLAQLYPVDFNLAL